MTLEEQVNQIYIDTAIMKPQVLGLAEKMDHFDARIRELETQSAKHTVEVPRLIADVDGLGRKLRHYEDRARVRQADDGGSKWVSFLEALVVLPKYWHVIVIGVTLVGGLIWKLAEILAHHMQHGGIQ